MARKAFKRAAKSPFPVAMSWDGFNAAQRLKYLNDTFPDLMLFVLDKEYVPSESDRNLNNNLLFIQGHLDEICPLLEHVRKRSLSAARALLDMNEPSARVRKQREADLQTLEKSPLHVFIAHMKNEDFVLKTEKTKKTMRRKKSERDPDKPDTEPM